MTELVNTEPGGKLSLLDSLAVQARTCILSARMNLLQLGRVLTEAKPLVPHGEWEAWVKANAEMSVRAAQGYMQAYATFGLNPDIARLGTTKTMKLLPLSDEEREALFAENNVEAMSTRQLDEAIRSQKEKILREARAAVEDARQAAQKEVERERKARIEAERRADAAESRPAKVPDDIQKQLQMKDKIIKDKEDEIREMANDFSESSHDISRLKDRVHGLEAEIAERDELLEEQQEEYNRVQAELMEVKSSIAKGDAERIPADQFTAEAFASAVRAFIGTCARMPHMRAAFSAMDDDQRQEYDELLRTVEGWAADSRKALDAVTVEGMVVEHD